MPASGAWGAPAQQRAPGGTSGTRKAQPVLLRVPLLHWLTVWAADRDGGAVACPKIQSHDPPGREVGKIPGPSPLGKREWELELQRRVDDKSLLAPDAIVALRAKEEPGSAAVPTWLSMLDAPLDVDEKGLDQQFESLANLTHIAAAHAARSLHALARCHAVPARPLQALQSAVSGTTLAAAARSAWAACPTFNCPAMRQELTKFLETVASRFGSSQRAPDANHQTLKDSQQLPRGTGSQTGERWPSIFSKTETSRWPSPTPSRPLKTFAAYTKPYGTAGSNTWCRQASDCRRWRSSSGPWRRFSASATAPQPTGSWPEPCSLPTTCPQSLNHRSPFPRQQQEWPCRPPWGIGP